MKLCSILVTVAMCLCACAQPARAHHLRYTANLTGAAELPGNNSAAIGHAVVTIDFDLLTMHIDTTFSGLEGAVLAANILGPTAEPGKGISDVMTQLPSFIDFPTGVTDGEYDHEFDLTDPASYNPAFIAAAGGAASDAMNQLFAALNGGKAYFNIRTTSYGDGEIRGFLSHVEGDYNLNGVVDAADYIVWRDTFGEIGDGLVADANDNSVIDTDDFDAWRNNFGAGGLSYTPASGTVASAAIPEPTSVVLTLLTIGVITVTRWRARS